MDQLWAPWRMTYIAKEGKPEGCPFCTKPAETRDRENLILHRGHSCFVVMNLFPYNNGHLMVIPYRHTADFTSLTTGEQSETMQLTQHCVRVLGETFRPEGFNLGMNLGHCAGAGVADHLHMHIVPRWGGDTNFMPVLAETRVLPDALFAGFDRLLPGFQKIAGSTG